MNKKMHKLDFKHEVKKGDFINVGGTYWLIVGTDMEFFNGNGVLLSNEIPTTRLMELHEDWIKEEYTDEYEWLRKGIYLYEKLIEGDPDNVSYQYSLGRVLFDKAIHMKRKLGTRNRAKSYFERVIRLNPHHPKAPLCEYQLGFLNLYEQEYVNGIHHFNQAIESGKLDYFQQLRAYCNLGICYSQIGEVEQANKCIMTARELDSKESRFTPEIEMANLQIQTAVRVYKPYTLLTIDSAERITETEAMRIADQYEDEGFVVLDCRGHKATVNGPKDSVEMTGISVDLLKILMTTKRPLSKTELSKEIEQESLGLRTIADSHIKVHMNNLRNKLKNCFNEDVRNIVQTNDNGYSWNRNYPFQIIFPYQKY